MYEIEIVAREIGRAEYTRRTGKSIWRPGVTGPSEMGLTVDANWAYYIAAAIASIKAQRDFDEKTIRNMSDEEFLAMIRRLEELRR